MNPLTANQLSQGANQRLGNCVHNRTARLRDPHQLANVYDLECEVRMICKPRETIPQWSPSISREDMAMARLFIDDQEFIAQTTVNLAEGT